MEINDTDRLAALHGAFNCLVHALHESGQLPTDLLIRNLFRAGNELEEKGLSEVAQEIDVIREHLDELLGLQSARRGNS